MSLLSRLLHSIPAVQRLEEERDTLRSEQNSIKLKLRAASAEMGVLEEQLRVLKTERDRLTEAAARHRAEHDSQAVRLKEALAVGETLTKERDKLAQERRTLIAQADAARKDGDRTSKALDSRRQKTGPG